MAIDVKELMAKVGKIQLLTRRLVDDELSGEYQSSFKGQGIEFDEVRAYVPGDDVRSIDWNVTARTGYPHVKRYAEERELTMLFLVDVSGSQGFGSRDRPKSELAALLACVLAMVAVRNEDNVGLIGFSDRIVKTVPARKGRTAVMRLVRDMLAMEGTRHGTDIAAALRFLNNAQKRRALVFVISDFQAPDFEHELRTTLHRHDVVALAVDDPAESALPDVGIVEMEDSETGGLFTVDTSSRAVRDAFAANAAAARDARTRLFHRIGVDSEAFLTTDSDDAVLAKIRGLFARRAYHEGRRS
ncbi:MAG: DUF58 domain-containing protein [Kiritimatiellia bacterium]|jgi:uncharacterized protein (DUF58 family)